MEKKITVTRFGSYNADNVNIERPFLEVTGNDDMDASDGYHTFTELYEHRINLFIALCRHLSREKVLPMHDDTADINKYYIWRSRRHSDGTAFDGWFIAGVGETTPHQISYHLPNDRWDECSFMVTRNNAPEWDGHTPDDVIQRLKTL